MASIVVFVVGLVFERWSTWNQLSRVRLLTELHFLLTKAPLSEIVFVIKFGVLVPCLAHDVDIFEIHNIAVIIA